MTKLDNGTIATDLDSDIDNAALLDQGYSIRQIETYHVSLRERPPSNVWSGGKTGAL